MTKRYKILIAILSFLALLTREKVCEHSGFGHAYLHGSVLRASDSDSSGFSYEEFSFGSSMGDSFIADTKLNSEDGPGNKKLRPKAQFVSYTSIDQDIGEPIRADWKVLMDIDYKLQYYKEFNMEIYAPVFTKAVKKLHGKEVIIDGHVIPLDVKQEIIALSYNPYSSCFFCGQASPASVISLHLNDKNKRYKKDSFKKFRGTLYLNQDDPDEFYYILRDAVEMKK